MGNAGSGSCFRVEVVLSMSEESCEGIDAVWGWAIDVESCFIVACGWILSLEKDTWRAAESSCGFEGGCSMSIARGSLGGRSG